MDAWLDQSSSDGVAIRDRLLPVRFHIIVGPMTRIKLDVVFIRNSPNGGNQLAAGRQNTLVESIRLRHRGQSLLYATDLLTYVSVML